MSRDAMLRRWFSMSWRFSLVLLVLLLIFALPMSYLLFAPAPLNPLAMLQSWQPNHLALRTLVVALIIVVLSCFFAYHVSRASDPFEDVAAIIRRIGTGDFRARLDSTSKREPHELTQIRQALNTMAADLQRAEELRTNLMADVSHELRTPLTALEGNLRAALDRVYPLDEAEIATLYGQTRHLIRLVNDLHELALADAHQLPLALQPTDLAQLLQETLSLFAQLAEEQDVALASNINHLPTLVVDAARIRQVLHNLLSNALRHTPAGGAITVAARADDQAIVIGITDTGDGLETDQLHAVFDRFYRTDKSRSRDTGGTGLGLAIVSAIIATHGGSIHASSAGLGHGSTFTITLPIKPQSARS